MGLSILRDSIALVPQDSTMFIGTLRSNLWAPCMVFRYRFMTIFCYRDPKGLRTDAELVSVIQRAGLLSSANSPDPAEAKFSLDSKVGDEGLCYSTLQLFFLC